MAQTPDGYLWLATRGGLVRFDGVRFTTYRAGSVQGLESSTVQDLLVDKDGSLWIATLGGGVSHYQGGIFHSYTMREGLPSNDIMFLYRDREGALWASTRDGKIARLEQSRFQILPLQIPTGPVTALVEGDDHSLWISTFGNGIFRLQQGVLTRFSVKDGLPDARVAGLYRDRSGKIWTAGWKGLSWWNGTRFIGDTTVNAAVDYAIACTEDRDGNMWIASSSGLFRVQRGKVTNVDRYPGLSGEFSSDVFEDREGNLWIATRAGLDRLRDGPVQVFGAKEGLNGNSQPVVIGGGGDVWTVSDRKIGRFTGNELAANRLSLPSGARPITLLSEPGSRFLIGFDRGVILWRGQIAEAVPEFAGLDVRCMLQSHDGSIWLGTANRGLLRWNSSRGSHALPESVVPDKFIVTLAEDRTGAIWAGSISGSGLYQILGNRVKIFGRSEGLRSAYVYTVFVDDKDRLWIGSTSGLSWFQSGKLRTASSQQGLPSDQIFAIADDSYDRLWFATFAGIAAIEKNSLSEWADGKRDRLTPTVYRSADGLQIYTVGRTFPCAVRSADGHLWFSTAEGIAEVTPPHPDAPRKGEFPVLIEDVRIDGASHFGPKRIRIPPGTRSVEVGYTALRLSDPESVRFRYRLLGTDNNWISADSRRVAFYNLKPGTYTFQVSASAEREQWREAPALVMEQLPFFYQTKWFALLAFTTAASLTLVAFRFRLHQIAQEFNARMEERVGERTRIARELHDTLLQSFQGLMLRLQVVDELLPEGRAKEELEQSLERADRAIAEGRDAVQDLRLSAMPTNDLAQAVRELGNQLAAEDAAAFRLVVEGPTRDLHPIVRDETYRIAREALRNAFSHAQAHQIEIEIMYGERLFRVRIRDDGQGIAPSILEEGRASHYGLPGMRERASQIGAKLSIWSAVRAGTEIELSIAGSIAYGKSPGRARVRLFRKEA